MTLEFQRRERTGVLADALARPWTPILCFCPLPLLTDMGNYLVAFDASEEALLCTFEV